MDGEQPLLRHAADAVLEAAPGPAVARLRGGAHLVAEVRAAVPPGASLGTSGAVLVALVAALDRLVGGGRDADALARLAHDAETRRAGREAGVQDQWAAAHGGAQLLAIGPYPEVRRQAVPLAPSTTAGLRDRLVTVSLGRHDSSLVHGRVITDLVTCSTDGHHRARQSLRRLSELAGDAADALGAGDLDRWGRVLTAATEQQAELGEGLVGHAHRRAVEVARAAGAVGWKVNGAGGEGGSLTVLAADAAAAARLRADLAAADPTWSVLDLTPWPAGVTATVTVTATAEADGGREP